MICGYGALHFRFFFGLQTESDFAFSFLHPAFKAIDAGGIIRKSIYHFFIIDDMDFIDTVLSVGKSWLGSGEKGKGVTGIESLDGILAKVPGLGSEAEKTGAEGQKERSSLFGEVWESFLNRFFPNVSKILDLGSAAGLKEGDIEAVPWQNEFETITALSLFVPDFILHYITDPFAESDKFLTLVEYWPLLGKETADLIRKDKNPDDVVNAIRVMHQDMVTGKVGLEQIKEWLAAGVAALAASTGIDKIPVLKDILPKGSQKITELFEKTPAAELTTLQKNIVSLLKSLKVIDTAVIAPGAPDWKGNNDYIQVDFEYNQKKYSLMLDNDSSGWDIIVYREDKTEVYNGSDYGTGDLDVEEDAKAILDLLAKEAAPKAA